MLQVFAVDLCHMWPTCMVFELAVDWVAVLSHLSGAKVWPYTPLADDLFTSMHSLQCCELAVSLVAATVTLDCRSAINR
jgi:hypothetical protein